MVSMCAVYQILAPLGYVSSHLCGAQVFHKRAVILGLFTSMFASTVGFSSESLKIHPRRYAGASSSCSAHKHPIGDQDYALYLRPAWYQTTLTQLHSMFI